MRTRQAPPFVAGLLAAPSPLQPTLRSTVRLGVRSPLHSGVRSHLWSALLFIFMSAGLAQGCTFKIFPWQQNEAKETDSGKNADAVADTSGTTPPQGSVPIFTGSTQAQAVFGTEVKLKVGESVGFAGADAVLAGTLKFVSVGEDSRCPAGVMCVWEGQATVTLNFARTQAPAGAADIVLTLRAGHDELATKSDNGYTFKLIALEPAPTPGAGQPSNRVARVVVAKN